MWCSLDTASRSEVCKHRKSCDCTQCPFQQVSHIWGSSCICLVGLSPTSCSSCNCPSGQRRIWSTWQLSRWDTRLYLCNKIWVWSQSCRSQQQDTTWSSRGQFQPACFPSGFSSCSWSVDHKSVLGARFWILRGIFLGDKWFLTLRSPRLSPDDPAHSSYKNCGHTARHRNQVLCKNQSKHCTGFLPVSREPLWPFIWLLEQVQV